MKRATATYRLHTRCCLSDVLVSLFAFECVIPSARKHRHVRPRPVRARVPSRLPSVARAINSHVGEDVENAPPNRYFPSEQCDLVLSSHRLNDAEFRSDTGTTRDKFAADGSPWLRRDRAMLVYCLRISGATVLAWILELWRLKVSDVRNFKWSGCSWRVSALEF